MPKCKNDSRKSYKGTEPSPKGLGYCAHVIKVNTKKKGKNGNYWEVRKIKNGSKRWFKYNKISKYTEVENFFYDKSKTKYIKKQFSSNIIIELSISFSIYNYKNEITKKYLSTNSLPKKYIKNVKNFIKNEYLLDAHLGMYLNMNHDIIFDKIVLSDNSIKFYIRKRDNTSFLGTEIYEMYEAEYNDAGGEIVDSYTIYYNNEELIINKDIKSIKTEKYIFT